MLPIPIELVLIISRYLNFLERTRLRLTCRAYFYAIPKVLDDFYNYDTYYNGGYNYDYIQRYQYVRGIYIHGDSIRQINDEGITTIQLVYDEFMDHEPQISVNNVSHICIKSINNSLGGHSFFKNTSFNMLTHLELGGYEDILSGILPPNLKYLNVGDSFNKSVDDLPLLETLILGNSFDGNVDKLPITLKTLVIGNAFRKSVDNLPPNLISLTIGDGFNGNVDNLPLSLIKFKVGNRFNNNVDHLPFKLISLILGHRFNKTIDNLPDLLYLMIGDSFDQDIKHLPRSLLCLSLGRSFDPMKLNVPSSLPDSITHLTLNYLVVNDDLRLPSNLLSLKLYLPINISIHNKVFKSLMYLQLGKDKDKCKMSFTKKIIYHS
jgi:hypothetical protein